MELNLPTIIIAALIAAAVLILVLFAENKIAKNSK